jgi:hypothetical protein
MMNNEDLAFPYMMMILKLLKYHTKTKELVELFDIKRVFYVINRYILEILLLWTKMVTYYF